MIDRATYQRVQQRTVELIRASGIAVAPEELERINVIDFGLGDVETEGVETIDLLSTRRLWIKVMVLLPNQTLPQHVHPPYDDDPGKEETLRVVYGAVRVYLPGHETIKDGFLLPGKEEHYSVRHEVVLNPVQQITIDPGMPHWFQAGPGGAVTYSFYSQADERHTRFADPNVAGVVGCAEP